MFALFFGTFTSEYVYAVLCYFSQANVFALFMVLSRANVFSLCFRCLWYLHERMSSLFMLFFSSECVYAVYGTFTSAYVYYVIFSQADVFTLGYM